MSLQDRQASGIRRRRPSTISKKKNSETSGSILIKFNVNHHFVWGGVIALGFGADCIKIVVSMATDSSHRLTMGKTKKKNKKKKKKNL